MSTTVYFRPKSQNAKTGPIPVSTSSENTCPPACPLKDAGCYAQHGPVGMLWRLVSRTAPGDSVVNGRGGTLRTLTWAAFCDAITRLPAGTFWRHNQAGDLPGSGDHIDGEALAELVDANKGRRGFTYTHKPVIGHANNRAAIEDANREGFTINLSANTLGEADTLADNCVAPVVVVLPAEVQGNVDIRTPANRRVTVCPATYRDDVSCASCQLCQRSYRKTIVGFPAHGAAKRKASAIAAA